MLRISALNDTSGTDSDNDVAQVETREAQEANLLNLYTTALKMLARKDIKHAKQNLLEIINSPVFKESKEETLARSLKYNVHKNLGDCYLQEGEVSLAQQEMLQATELDDGDVTLWFKIAGTAVKLKNLYMCRSALEQGLRVCNNHWPSIDNLITVTYKLGDYLACLGYCSLAEEIEPGHQKIILFKSKVYNEMPFLQEAYSDTGFKPVPTEMEVFDAPAKVEPPREPLPLTLEDLTLECLARNIREMSELCDREDKALHPVDTASAVKRLQEEKLRQEEMKIRVSVQNVVEEIIDIIEEEEEVIAYVEDILDDMLCDMFGVEPKPASEKVASHIVDVVLSGMFETNKKKSVIIEPKPRERKRASPMDEIPQELIEKRRSSRKSRIQEVALASETTADPVKIQTSRELLESFLPAELKSGKAFRKIVGRTDQSVASSSVSESEEGGKKSFVSKSLFDVKKTWFTEEEEKAAVEKFLSENSGKTIWFLMRSFLDYAFRLSNTLVWPEGLVTWTGRVYQSWRFHLADPLCVENPQEELTQEFLRYYILGSECLIGNLIRDQIDYSKLPPDTRDRMHQDLEELYSILAHLTIDLKLRVHSLRFFFFSILEVEEEVMFETGQLMRIYTENPDIPIFSCLPQYKMATKKYLEEYSRDVSRSKELEELNHYYEAERYEDIVKLVLGTLQDCNKFTPSKDASRVPDRETQIDILIESLFYTDKFGKCVEWSTTALTSCLQQMLVDPETGEPRKLTPGDLEVINAYLATMNACFVNSENKALDDVSLETASRLTSVLIQLLEIQIEDMTPQTLLSLPWILLHKLISFQESRSDGSPDTNCTDELPGSLSLLCSAHDYLGQKSCCTSEKGMLLNYILDVFIPIVISPKLPKYADQVKTSLDQAVYCLFAHPSKKSRVRHLADHGVSQIALTWERAKLIYRYLRPGKVPEHDDVKLMSISSDCENFMKRVVALIPDSVCVHKRRTAAEPVIEGKKRTPKVRKYKRLPPQLNDLFYFLADYAFKNSMDMDRALDWYTLDISFNPERYDTWAALGLTQASKMDKRLNSCKRLNPTTMLGHYESVKNCFERCIEMNDGNSNLYIEYGNFCYNFQSYISRTLNNNSDNMTIEMFEKLEKTKEALLEAAMRNYRKTLAIFEKDGIQENDVDERWLLHYMIGKIKEKAGNNLLESLECYLTSIKFLERSGAVLPKKVNYNSPQTWSVECLEMYYRVHASILKYLVKFENNVEGVALDMRRKIYDILKEVQLNKVFLTNAPDSRARRFSRKRKPVDVEDPDKQPRLEASTTSIMRDVIEVMDNCIDEVEFNLDTTKMEVPSLIQLSLQGLDDVAVHFFHHFKSIYRLAHYYFTSEKNKDMAKVEKLLLAGEKDKNVPYPGLFFGRKPNQIFNEIWRIPTTEIDRPGSFAAHCAKSLLLLVDVLRLIPDLNSLADIVLQLKKPPTEENKFIHDVDRVETGMMASTYLFNTIKSQVSSVSIDKERQKPNLIVDLYKIYQKLLKQWTGKEKEVMVAMKDLYGKIKGKSENDKISNEEVLRFCASELKIKTGKMTATTGSNSQPAASLKFAAHASSAVKSSDQSSGAPRATSGAQDNSGFRPDLVKDLSQQSAYLQKITNCMEVLALALPNMNVKDTLAVHGVNYDEQALKVNVLLAQLGRLSRAELLAIAVDQAKVNMIGMYAAKVGANLSSVNAHLSRLKSILNGTAATPKPGPKTGSGASAPTTAAKSAASAAPKPLLQSKASPASTKPKVSLASIAKLTGKSVVVSASNSPSFQASKPATSAAKPGTQTKPVLHATKQTNNAQFKAKAIKQNSDQYLKALQQIYATQGLVVNKDILMATQSYLSTSLVNAEQIKAAATAQKSQLKPKPGPVPTKTKQQQSKPTAVKMANIGKQGVVVGSKMASVAGKVGGSSSASPKTPTVGKPAVIPATDRVLNLPAGVTLTHVSSGKGSRSGSPAVARLGNASNPGSRSSSPKTVPVGSGGSANSSRTNSPAFLSAAGRVGSPALVAPKAGASNKSSDAKDALASFKAQMLKSLHVKEQSKKKTSVVEANKSPAASVKSPAASVKSPAASVKSTAASVKSTAASVKSPATSVKSTAASVKPLAGSIKSVSAGGGKAVASGSSSHQQQQAAGKSGNSGKQPAKSKSGGEPEIICIDID